MYNLIIHNLKLNVNSNSTEFQQISCDNLWLQGLQQITVTTSFGHLKSLSYSPLYDAESMCSIELKTSQGSIFE